MSKLDNEHADAAGKDVVETGDEKRGDDRDDHDERYVYERLAAARPHDMRELVPDVLEVGGNCVHRKRVSAQIKKDPRASNNARILWPICGVNRSNRQSGRWRDYSYL